MQYNMKKITAVAAACLLLATTHAQVKWGIHAGMVNTANSLNTKLTGAPSYSSGNGFTAGGTAAIILFKSVYSETSIFFCQKKFTERSAPMPAFFSNISYRLNYVVLNQNLVVKIAGKKGLSFSTGTGFFVAGAASGRFKAENNFSGGYMRFEDNLTIGNTADDDVKRFDAGINVLVRSQYKNVQLTMQYSPSFTNHAPYYGNDGYKEKFRSLSFTLGYEF
jgi:hypothetical protein